MEIRNLQVKGPRVYATLYNEENKIQVTGPLKYILFQAKKHKWTIRNLAEVTLQMLEIFAEEHRAKAA